MTIFNSYVKLPEGTISMNLQSILPHKNDDDDHGVFSSPVHEKPASQPRLASTRHQDAKGQGDPRQRWDLYTGLPALSGFVASVGGLLLLVKRNETNVSPLKGWYNCITLARYGYATNRYIYIYTRIYTYIYIYWFGDGRTLCGFWPTNTRAKHRLQGGVSLKSGARKWCHKAWANLQMWLTSTWINNGTLALG